MWILTDEWNLRDQAGEYFLEAFDEKPSAELLREVVTQHGYGEDQELLERVLAGGGRKGIEGSWLYLREYTPRDRR